MKPTLRALLCGLALLAIPPAALADTSFQTLPLNQNWATTTLITTNDNWSGVAGISGYLGSGLTSADGVDPQTVVADQTTLDVLANQSNPTTQAAGGVAEFDGISNPTIALQGSGSADAPFVLLSLNTSGQTNIQVTYTLRDIDGSGDNAVQPVALQFRVGASGNFTNVPAGFVADASSGPNLATLTTLVAATLPASANNQPQLQVRIITSNADGADEWIGIDDIAVSGTPAGPDSAPTVASSTPPDGATGVLPNATLSVTFSEPVNASTEAFTLVCAGNPLAVTAVTPNGSTITISHADFPTDASCTVTVVAAQVSDQDSDDPPDTMAANTNFTFLTTELLPPACLDPVTAIGAVQGSGNTAAISGAVTVRGVVVGDYEGASPALRGFYLQDASGDNNPATSDGIFVFNGSANSVAPGQVVQVNGTAGEFSGQTQISSPTITNCGTTGTIIPTNLTFPLPAAVGGVPYLERFEGMLVKVPETLTVTEHFQLGRFGQLTLAAGGRLFQPTNIASPGAPALAVQAENNLRKIVLDDASTAENPDPIIYGRGGQPLSAANTLRGGDTITGLTGVLGFSFSAYRMQPLASYPISFVAANPRPANLAAPTGTLRVASVNLLNYFNTFGANACTGGVGGSSGECRGASNAAEFARQHPKTVAAIVGSGADVIGVMELENDGYGATSAIRDLVDRLNAATAPGTYAFIDVDSRVGAVNALGSDFIKVALLYKPARVTPVGTTTVRNTGAFGPFDLVGGGQSQRNRPALAQSFSEVASGQRFTVVVNHLKSKGSACSDNAATSPAPADSDQNDGQGNCNQTRTKAAAELATWLASDPTGINDPDVLIIGDLNAYAKEDPISTLVQAGYTELIAKEIGAGAYSYAFDGQWGYLDHALASGSMAAQVSGSTEWHINADEPTILDYNSDFESPSQQASLYAADQYRASDHDPVLVELRLGQQLTYLPSVYGP